MKASVPSWPLVSALVAMAATALLIPLLRRLCLARDLLLDTPNARSSHASPKPRIGGLAILGGIAAGGIVLAVTEGLPTGTWAVLAGAVMFSVVGLFDDVRRLSERSRLAVELLVAVCVVSQTGPLDRLPLPEPARIPLGIFSMAVSVVWLVGVANFFNFMDGIDGLAGGQAAAICAAVLFSGWSADASILAALTLGSVLGFLRYNWWPSRVFLGDTGSLLVGFLLAGMPLVAPPAQRPHALLATAIGLALFLLDPVVTLIRRWRRGAPLGRAARDHVFHELLGPVDPHGWISASLVAAGLLLGLLGSLVYHRPQWGWAGILVAALAFAGELFAGARIRRRRGAMVAHHREERPVFGAPAGLLSLDPSRRPVESQRRIDRPARRQPSSSPSPAGPQARI